MDDTNQCVEKQNNVYFKLLDLDTDNRQAIVKSEYDSRKYLITYGSGCYASSITRYKNRQIVINLGTDFDLDTYDRIVLQDDNEVCDITHRERTYDDSLAKEDTSSDYTYVPPPGNTVVTTQPAEGLSAVPAVSHVATPPAKVTPLYDKYKAETKTPAKERQKKQAAPLIKKQDVKKATEATTTPQATTTSHEQANSVPKPRSLWEKLVSPFKNFREIIFK